MGLPLQNRVNLVAEAIAVERHAEMAGKGLTNGHRHRPRPTGARQAQRHLLHSGLSWSGGPGRERLQFHLHGLVVWIGQPDQALLPRHRLNWLWPELPIEPVPMPPQFRSGRLIHQPGGAVFDMAPLVQLPGSPWVSVGELQQKLDQFGVRRLLGEPLPQGGLGVPERFELLEVEFNQLAGFGGAQMFDRPLMQPIQPAQPAAAFIPFDGSPLILWWLLTQASHHATAHHPDRGGHVAGRQQNVTGGEAAHFDVRWQQLVQVEVLCQGGRHHESERRSEYRLSAVSPGLICRWICSRTVARSGRVPGNWSRGSGGSLWPRAQRSWLGQSVCL